MSKISVIVTNWNGVNILKKNLIKIIETSPEAQEIILTDDASSDDSLDYVREVQKKYPKLKIISHSDNVGFGKNSNFAVSEAQGEFIVLLNNDIVPHPKYISNALPHFKDPLVAGVGFAESGNENWGKIFWKSGYLQHQPGTDISKTHITAWISGGSSIVRKDIFQKFGGFDQVYAPFYSEDLDLGYRLWKSGYKLLWEPKSVVEHKHETTISRFPKSLLNYVKERNRLLTVLRNITDPQMLRSNRLTLIGRVLTGPNYLKIILAAKKQIANSPAPIVFPKLSDQEVFNLFNS